MDNSNNKTTILKNRALKISHPLSVDDKTDLISLVKFKLGKEIYAVETTYIDEILKKTYMSKIPNTPPFILGIVNIRSKIYCVNDLFLLLDIESFIDDTYDKLMIVKNEKIELGFLLKDILGEFKVLKKSIQTNLNSLQVQKIDLIVGVLPEGTIVLDLEKILSNENLVVSKT